MNDTEKERKFIFQEILEAILPTFYEQLFLCESYTKQLFFVFEVWLHTFSHKKKLFFKMLVKLIPSDPCSLENVVFADLTFQTQKSLKP
jgi:hypothetical protein